MVTIFTNKSPIKFECDICDYNTCNKKDYSKHISTPKHIKMTNMVTCGDNNPLPLVCMCGNTYKYRQGLSRHKKTCTDIINNTIVDILPQPKQPDQPLKTSSEDTIHTNSHNKTFNLQVFLNETCKDAMNMKDFIKSLELSMTELERMGEVGFAEGMSKLFVDRLNILDITKRPIHCSDVKREIIHIKDDNKWERDNANLDRLRKIIKQLTHKNILRVDDWKKANPGCTEYNSRKNDQYLRINMEAIGPVDEADEKRDFGKIIRRVAESTAIDKKYL